MPRWVVLLVVAVAGVVIVAGVFFSALTGTTGVALNRGAQSNLVNGLTLVRAAEKATGSSYAPVTTALLRSSAPAFDWIPDGPTRGLTFADGAIGVDTCADGPACQAVVLAVFSPASDVCWYILSADTAPAAVTLGVPRTGTWYGYRQDPGPCSAGTPDHPSRPASGWLTEIPRNDEPHG
jgi:hypothetical protein